MIARTLVLILPLSIGIAACSPGRSVDTTGDTSSLSAPRNHLLGEDRSATGGDQTQAGVNAYLWRGAIDTLSFMPFASADPVGGIILTDWYSPPTTSGERFKATAYVLGKQLRSDAIRWRSSARPSRTGNGSMPPWRRTPRPTSPTRSWPAPASCAPIPARPATRP